MGLCSSEYHLDASDQSPGCGAGLRRAHYVLSQKASCSGSRCQI